MGCPCERCCPRLLLLLLLCYLPSLRGFAWLAPHAVLLPPCHANSHAWPRLGCLQGAVRPSACVPAGHVAPPLAAGAAGVLQEHPPQARPRRQECQVPGVHHLPLVPPEDNQPEDAMLLLPRQQGQCVRRGVCGRHLWQLPVDALWCVARCGKQPQKRSALLWPPAAVNGARPGPNLPLLPTLPSASQGCFCRCVSCCSTPCCAAGCRREPA